MFLVRLQIPLTEGWEESHNRIVKASQCYQFQRAVDKTHMNYEWVVDEFQDALRMRCRLEIIANTKVSLRES